MMHRNLSIWYKKITFQQLLNIRISYMHAWHHMIMTNSGILFQIQVDKPNMNFLLMVLVVCCTTRAQLQDSTTSIVHIILINNIICYSIVGPGIYGSISLIHGNPCYSSDWSWLRRALRVLHRNCHSIQIFIETNLGSNDDCHLCYKMHAK